MLNKGRKNSEEYVNKIRRDTITFEESEQWYICTRTPFVDIAIRNRDMCSGWQRCSSSGRASRGKSNDVFTWIHDNLST